MNSKTSGFHIALVEDDVWYGELLKHHLELNPDFLVSRFESGQDFLKQISQDISVLCLDLSLPDIKGDELLKKIRFTHPELPVIFISGNEDVKTAIELLKQEYVYDYIVKDDEAKDRLWKSLINIKKHANLKKEVEVLKEEVAKKYDYSNTIIGNSPAIQEVFKMMDKACRTNITVSIKGDTGTGKELIAKCIHYNSHQKKGKFIAVNVAAIPSELLESELFGHEKGAFTGAVNRHIGKFEQAQNGTIFLDEIAELPSAAQVKLLRVLQEREITRVGGSEQIKINARVIVATHKDLLEEVSAGRFREDLYYRLLGLPIKNPTLIERKEDILVLAKHFIDSFCKENKIGPKILSEQTKHKLLSYPFPGNVRELKSVMDLACVMSDENEIEPHDITFTSTGNFENFIKQEMTLKQYNAHIIRHFLDKYPKDIVKVADVLDIGKSTIYRMIQNGEV